MGDYRRCKACGQEILTAEERAAREIYYTRLRADLATARREVARLSYELELARSPRLECHVTVPIASLGDRQDVADLVAQAFARREDEWRRAMELEMESEMKTRAEMQERTKT